VTCSGTMFPSEADLAARFRGAMPKDSTGSSRFLAEHPEYDGRGVVVAVFDTGVDPAAAGLQETTTGEPKVIDIVDCTGSGDVLMDTIVRTAEDGVTLDGGDTPGGRPLKVNPAWENPSGDWRLGRMRAFSLFPRGLVAKMKGERAKKWDTMQRAAVTAATAALASFNRLNPQPGSEALKKEKLELENRVKLLEDLEAAREDPGPMVHCVVWHDGKVWRAALDTAELYDEHSGEGGGEKGLLVDCPPLTNFAVERKYGTFSSLDACSYGVNIYDEGTTLSIVVDAGSHGTHVAGITAAYHPEDPHLNGVAPGAQIISCKIGDRRLGSMETHTGLTRALIHAIAQKADLINMSYGEATTTPDVGRFVDMATEVVNKHGIIFVSSAGNSGPALSTVGAPGGTTSAIISVGAYVSPDLAAAGHSLREVDSEGQQYTWSSRGPTLDGDLGVVLSAPGGAVAPVPNWTEQRRQLMNGTSMASPNACGCIALLLSGLKAEGLPRTPAAVRRALENSCLSVRPGEPDNFLTHGRGLIQVDRAWEKLTSTAKLDVPDFWYSVRCRVAGGMAWQRGVYLREPGEADNTVNVTVDASPQMHEEADVASERLAIEHKLVLRPTAPWIRCPEVLLVLHNGRTFEMSLDCAALPEGLHYAEVEALDSTALSRGPLFRVPITVVKPSAVQEGAAARPPPPSFSSRGGQQPLYGSLHGAGLPPLPRSCTASFPLMEFSAGEEHRRFVAIPRGATWCEMKLSSSLDAANPRSYIVRATQLRPAHSFAEGEGVHTFVQLGSEAEWSRSFAVRGGGTLEVTVAQFWSSLGSSRLSCDLDFHGLVLEGGGPQGGVVLQAGGPVRVEITAPLRREKLSPKATLSAVQFSVRPAEATLDSLATPRDTMPDHRVVHQLTLTYKFKAAEPGKYVASLPGITGLVYDGSFEVAPIMLFDTNKQLVATWDPAGPSPVKVGKKANYTVRLVLRHDKAAHLEKLRSLPLVLLRKLDSPLPVPVYATNDAAVTAGKSFGSPAALPEGGAAALFLGPLPDDKMPKDAAPGKSLVGSLSLGLCAGKGAAAPHSLPLELPCPPAKAIPDTNSAGGGSSAAEEEEKSAEEKLGEVLRDAKVKFLKDLKTDTPEKQALYYSTRSELLAAYPAHLPLLLEGLSRLSDAAKAGAGGKAAALEHVVEAADEIIGAIDTAAVAEHVARKCHDEDGAEAAAAKKAMDEKKAALVEALAAKCTALLDLEEASPGGTASCGETGTAAAPAAEPADEAEGGEEKPAPDNAPAAADRFLAAFTELRRWVDTASDSKHMLLHSRSEARSGRLAGALKALEKLADPEDKPAEASVLDRQVELLDSLGWHHWATHFRGRKLDAFPSSLPPV